ncbi:MAG: YdcF family protein [Minisyncoccia bacterium]|jgi:uncharacterized SAM-binding protein YcdF (DUF218 family)
MEFFVLLGARTPRNERGEITFPLVAGTRTNSNASMEEEVSGGWARMGGLRILKQQFTSNVHPSDLIVFVTGGQEPGADASRAENMARALVETFGFDPAKVIPIRGKGSTQGNAESIIRYMVEKKYMKKTPLVLNLVTNDYHMLRAWLLFAFAFYEHHNGTSLVLPAEDIETIRTILKKATEKLAEKKKCDPDAFREVRDHVLSIVRPHLLGELAVQLEPCVVEDIFQHTHRHLLERYAEWLREHPKVLETTKYEYKGVMDLLEGKYGL